MYTLDQLAGKFGGEVRGDGSTEIRRITSLESAGEGDLAPAGEERFRRAAVATKAAALLVLPELADVNDAPKIVHPFPLMVANAIIEDFGVIEPRRKPMIHPTAVVDGEIGVDCWIGPYAVIEKGARIGDRCEIHPNVTIERGVVLGNDCRIEPGAVLHSGLEAGNHVVIGANAVVSRQGFGYGMSPEGLTHLHHIGKVILEDRVHIGALSAVDRARFDITFFGNRSAFDNLCQFGHNTIVGKHSYGAAQIGLAGRSVVGDFCQLGGQSAIAMGAKMGHHTKLGAQSGLITDMDDKADYFGSPAMPKREYLRERRAMKRIIREWEDRKKK